MPSADDNEREDRAEMEPRPASTRLNRDRHGFPVVKAEGPVITSEMVREESEDDDNAKLEALRALIDEGDACDPATDVDGEQFLDEMREHIAARGRYKAVCDAKS